MKNTINISNNVNLILNTYRCIFFQTATGNLRCCLTTSTMPCKTSQQDSLEMERFWNLASYWLRLQRSKFVNHNSAKMNDVWNVNKLTEARTKLAVGNCTDQSRAMIKSVSSNEVGTNVKKTNTDFGISLLNMEYVIRNMSVLIPCQEPSFSDITINF